MPERIQLRRTKGWRLPLNAKHVGRPSRWGNPLRVVDGSVVGQSWSMVRANFGGRALTDGQVLYSSHSDPAAAVEHAVDLFRILATVTKREEPARYERWIAPLRGRDLACWCPLPAPGETDWCHAAVLLELAAGGES